MPFETVHLTIDERKALLTRDEGQFIDFKAKDIAPGKLIKHLAAFANADGGELFVGIFQKGDGSFGWSGFTNDEEANGHIQCVLEHFPIGEHVDISFLETNTIRRTKVLRILIEKTPDARKSNDGIYYLRRGAQSLPQKSEAQIERLKLNKGVISHETRLTTAKAEEVLASKTMKGFIKSVVPHSTAQEFLARQKLVNQNKITVAGVLLFDDEPQVYLPKASVKIYRYETSDEFGTRERLKGQPITVEGSATQIIKDAVEKTAKITESINVLRAGKLQKVKYPREAIHEIITNAVIHRDYSLPDNIHIRIFDNRIEIQSPGKLPGYVTVENIRKERFSRNGQIVRLINKFPDPPNKDVGEGMNTAFEFMEKLQLKAPIIQEDDNSVSVILRHEALARPETIILSFLQENASINNKTARELTGIGSENKVKNIFKKMIDEGLIQIVMGKRGNKTSYEITAQGRNADTSGVN